MAAHHPHPLGLDGQSRLGGLLLGDNHHRAQVDYPSAVGGTELMIINNPRQDEEKPQNVALMKKKNWLPLTSWAEDILSSWTCLYR